MLEYAIRKPDKREQGINVTLGESDWGPSRFQRRTVEPQLSLIHYFVGGCENCLAIDEEESPPTSIRIADHSTSPSVPAKAVSLHTGQLSLLLLISLFRKFTVPWPHFVMLVIAVAIAIWSTVAGIFAAAFTAVFAAVIFLATGFSSVWVRRKMGHG